MGVVNDPLLQIHSGHAIFGNFTAIFGMSSLAVLPFASSTLMKYKKMTSRYVSKITTFLFFDTSKSFGISSGHHSKVLKYSNIIFFSYNSYFPFLFYCRQEVMLAWSMVVITEMVLGGNKKNGAN